MNMRERCARAVAAVGDHPGMAKVWNSPMGRENSYKFVDAVLDTLTANPGDHVLCAALEAALPFLQESPPVVIVTRHAGEIFGAMIRAIKEGK